MSRLFVPGTEQPRIEQGRASIGTDGLGWLTPGRARASVGNFGTLYPKGLVARIAQPRFLN